MNGGLISGAVSIGVPVYNEAGFIEKCILSAIDQADYLLISDNASSDGTSDICERLALELPRLEFSFQQSNQGAFFNFRFLLDRCRTEYFMWLGAHDYIPPNYIRSLKAHLETDAEAVLAYGTANHVALKSNVVIRTNTYSGLARRLECENSDRRALSIISSLGDCTLIHGLWRTETLRKAWVDEELLGGDHVLLLKAAMLGRFKHVPTVSYNRGHPERLNSKLLQMQRITGKKEKTVSRARLCELSLESLGESKALSYTKLTYLKAHVLLAYRFGSFSKEPLINLIQSSIHSLRRFIDFARTCVVR